MRWADFAGAEFGADVSFNNRRFTDTTNFRGAIFGEAPKFHNACYTTTPISLARDLRSVAFAPCPFDYLSFTLRQTFRPFEVWSSRPDLIEPFACYGLVEPPLLLHLLATLQSLFTFGLFTLFLLALRKRFRMI